MTAWAMKSAVRGGIRGDEVASAIRASVWSARRAFSSGVVLCLTSGDDKHAV